MNSRVETQNDQGIVIFRLFKMASAAIFVGFSKFQTLNGRIGQECQTASLRQISRFELRYGAKPHRNRSTRYRYMAIF